MYKVTSRFGIKYQHPVSGYASLEYLGEYSEDFLSDKFSKEVIDEFIKDGKLEKVESPGVVDTIKAGISAITSKIDNFASK